MVKNRWKTRFFKTCLHVSNFFQRSFCHIENGLIYGFRLIFVGVQNSFRKLINRLNGHIRVILVEYAVVYIKIWIIFICDTCFEKVRLQINCCFYFIIYIFLSIGAVNYYQLATRECIASCPYRGHDDFPIVTQ